MAGILCVPVHLFSLAYFPMDIFHVYILFYGLSEESPSWRAAQVCCWDHSRQHEHPKRHQGWVLDDGSIQLGRCPDALRNSNSLSRAMSMNLCPKCEAERDNGWMGL